MVRFGMWVAQIILMPSSEAVGITIAAADSISHIGYMIAYETKRVCSTWVQNQICCRSTWVEFFYLVQNNKCFKYHWGYLLLVAGCELCDNFDTGFILSENAYWRSHRSHKWRHLFQIYAIICIFWHVDHTVNWKGCWNVLPCQHFKTVWLSDSVVKKLDSTPTW